MPTVATSETVPVSPLQRESDLPTHLRVAAVRDRPAMLPLVQNFHLVYEYGGRSHSTPNVVFCSLETVRVRPTVSTDYERKVSVSLAWSIKQWHALAHYLSDHPFAYSKAWFEISIEPHINTLSNYPR